MSRGHRFDPVWRPYTDKDQPSFSRIIEVHWFRPALDSSGEQPQLPTSVVPYRVLYSWHVLHPYLWGTPTRPIGINQQPSHSRTTSKQNPTLQNLARDILPPPFHARPRAWGVAPTPDQYGAISSHLLVARTTPLPLGYFNKTNRNIPATLAFTYSFQAEPDPSEFGP
nr:hypothetical protein [Tanacetum cinerariifolium]